MFTNSRGSGDIIFLATVTLLVASVGAGAVALIDVGSLSQPEFELTGEDNSTITYTGDNNVVDTSSTRRVVFKYEKGGHVHEHVVYTADKSEFDSSLPDDRVTYRQSSDVDDKLQDGDVVYDVDNFDTSDQIPRNKQVEIFWERPDNEGSLVQTVFIPGQETLGTTLSSKGNITLAGGSTAGVNFTN